jgi:hypothetical protein
MKERFKIALALLNALSVLQGLFLTLWELIQALYAKRARLDIIRKRALRRAIRAMLEHTLIETELRIVLAALLARFLSRLGQILLPHVSNAH